MPSYMKVLLPHFLIAGASGLIAYSMSRTGSCSSISSSTSEAASRAISSLSATTAQIGSPDVHHLLVRQHRLIRGADADQAEDRVPVVGHVRGGDHRGDAGEGGGPRRIDPADAPAGHGAADHLQPEHIRVEHVVHVLGLAGDVAEAVAPLDRLADDAERFHDRRILSAASSTASIIGR